MVQKLNLADKYFIEAIIKVIKHLKETMFLMSELIGNLSKEMETTKNN